MMNWFFCRSAHCPAFAQVLQQTLTAELRQNIDGKDTGVDEVAQNEVDDPVFAAEGHRRFGAFLGEWVKPGSLAAGQYDSEHAQLHGEAILSASASIGK